MPTTQSIMTTQEVANRFKELADTGEFEKIQAELFSDDAESIEPPNSEGLQTAKGMKAIKEKAEQWNQMVKEVHSGYSTEPVVAGKYFTVAMGLDVSLKDGNRMKMDEIALYEVRDGKIVKEQFFY
jgi:ketosteroid isomerase-like protein